MYNCVVCKRHFETAVLLRVHHKSDYHIVNLRRALESLPPISESAFRRHEEPTTLSSSWKNVTVPDVSRSNETIPCVHDTTQSFSQISSCTSSRKPFDELIYAEESPEAASSNSQAITYKPFDSLFDSCHFSVATEALSYMEKKYSFFIPNSEYLVDLPQFLYALGTLICVEHICLYCYKRFASLISVQQHMIDKGHTILRLEDSEIKNFIHNFYDFTPSYEKIVEGLSYVSASDAPAITVSGREEAANRPTETSDAIAEGEEDDDEWEDLGTEHSTEAEEEADRIAKYFSERGLQKAYITDSGTLVLPTGKEVVNRHVAYILKQRFSFRSPVALKMLNNKERTTHHLVRSKMSASAKANGEQEKLAFKFMVQSKREFLYQQLRNQVNYNIAAKKIMR